MKTLLVSYDLKSPGKDYSKLWEHLRSYSGYAKPLESFWLIKTELSAEDARDTISGYIDSNDRIVVINVTGDEAAWKNLSTEASNWIKQNL
ncbi:MAG: CRISPR-associated protein Cas2 [Candidatus Moranbacteria bacterium]|nr:CRISPR-associated protein Cas2 [Candidatus Moranbacteria bacterium]